MNRIFILSLFVLNSIWGSAQGVEEFFDFTYDGIELSGVLNFPSDRDPKGIVLIIHGDGRTDAVAGKWWYDVRHAIIKAGYATLMWDKMGCGYSEGTYVQGRSVADEALEVLEAINALEERDISGADHIGLWGISRAGWINPLVINKTEAVDFWISVSGVCGYETFRYLLEKNLQISGLPKDSVELITKEWHDGLLLSKAGVSYEYYKASTINLQTNSFWQRFTNGGVSESAYYDYQKGLLKSQLDRKADLPVYVDDFETILSQIDIPVLALFGERDMTVDWKSTKELYERTLKTNTSLSIRTFPDGNHNMWSCNTGGFYEFTDEGLEYKRCIGFLESITDWLNDLER